MKQLNRAYKLTGPTRNRDYYVTTRLKEYPPQKRVIKYSYDDDPTNKISIQFPYLQFTLAKFSAINSGTHFSRLYISASHKSIHENFNHQQSLRFFPNLIRGAVCLGADNEPTYGAKLNEVITAFWNTSFEGTERYNWQALAQDLREYDNFIPPLKQSNYKDSIFTWEEYK